MPNIGDYLTRNELRRRAEFLDAKLTESHVHRSHPQSASDIGYDHYIRLHVKNSDDAVPSRRKFRVGDLAWFPRVQECVKIISLDTVEVYGSRSEVTYKLFKRDSDYTVGYKGQRWTGVSADELLPY